MVTKLKYLFDKEVDYVIILYSNLFTTKLPIKSCGQWFFIGFLNDSWQMMMQLLEVASASSARQWKTTDYNLHVVHVYEGSFYEEFQYGSIILI